MPSHNFQTPRAVANPEHSSLFSDLLPTTWFETTFAGTDDFGEKWFPLSQNVGGRILCTSSNPDWFPRISVKHKQNIESPRAISASSENPDKRALSKIFFPFQIMFGDKFPLHATLPVVVTGVKGIPPKEPKPNSA